MDARYRIRRASPADADALSVLERRCFSDPWSAQGFREVLSTPISFGLVAAAGKELQGYFLARLVAGEAEVLNLAVNPDQRRRGIGRALLEAGLRELQLRGGREVFLEVRESNAAARAMDLELGFRVVGARQRYYRLPVEDALVLHLPLPTFACATTDVDSG
jgi:ribosomal-protein-alanine N-acetyltransferase